MWNIKYFAIPVITGTMGILTGGLRKVSGNNTRKHSIASLQKQNG
jgi:hypothetical protein